MSLVIISHLANSDINWGRDYGYFKDLVLRHSINRPPISEKIFSYKEMLAVVDYVTNTYFRHYLLYKYAFTKKMRVEFVIENFMPVKSENLLQEVEEEEIQEQPQEEERPPEEEDPIEAEQSDEFVPSQEVLHEEIEPEESLPFRSPKHEEAINELKSYITSVLATKLDEIKAAVSQKIIAQDESANPKIKEDDKKKAAGKPKK
ncbi:hypothetical protein HDV06_004112 [Boothiomyces sp. JEL0866]|nr:hypothetical protein HDV06_007093 [Boothiomyces sp. JEL0866]KAJ3321576.1 hypothetical protein HDV06_004112 [Boothiomyces sp. JEL0866]